MPAKEFRDTTGAGPYGDFVAQSDWSAGQVLAALEEHGFAENTIVVFASDNGPEHYAFERTRRHGHRSMGALRGLERDVWEGGHRVPMVVRWPRRIEAGSVCGALVCQTDLPRPLGGPAGQVEQRRRVRRLPGR